MIPAILVLGSSVTERFGKWVPGRSFKARLDTALEVATKFNVWTIIIAGRGKKSLANPEVPAEAEAGAQYLRSQGLPYEYVILKETYSNETIGNFIYATAAFIQPLRIPRITTITSSFHCNRAQKIAAHLWGTKVGHDIIHAVEPSIDLTDEWSDFETSDFVRDFVDDKTNKEDLNSALRWLKQNYKEPEIVGSCYDSPEQVAKNLSGTVPEPLRGFMDGRYEHFENWMDEFLKLGSNRRRLYLYCAKTREDKHPFADDDVTAFRAALANIGRLGNLAHEHPESYPPELVSMLVHQVPLKLWSAVEQNRECLSNEERLGFRYVERLGLQFIHRLGITATLYPGQRDFDSGGEKVKELQWTHQDIEAELLAAEAELRRDGWLCS